MSIEQENFICEIIAEFNKIDIAKIIEKFDDLKSYINDVEVMCCPQENLNHNANGRMICDDFWNCHAEIYPYNINKFLDAIQQNCLRDQGRELLYDGTIKNLFSKLLNREDYTALKLIIEFIICHELVHALQTKKLQVHFSVIKEDPTWDRCCERVSDTIAKAYLINASNGLGLCISNYFLLYRFGSNGSSCFVDGVKKYCKADSHQTVLPRSSYCQVFGGREILANNLLLENYLPLSDISILINDFCEWSANRVNQGAAIR